MITCRSMKIMVSTTVLFVIITLAGCSSSGSGHTPVPESLSVAMISPASDVTISSGTLISFQAQVSGGANPYSYLWDFGGSANSTTREDPGQITFDTAGSYTVKLTVTDSKGVAASASVKVTVEDGPTDTPPAILYTTPSKNAKIVDTSAVIQVRFNQTVDLSTVTTSTFTLKTGVKPVEGSVEYTGLTATFIPSAPLAYSALYDVTISKEIRDIIGNPVMAEDYAWSFTTKGYSLEAVITSPAGNVTVLEGQPVNFQGSITGGKAPYTCKWNFSLGMPDSAEISPGDITFSTRGTYTAVFRVTDADNNVSYASVGITVYSTTAGDWSGVSAGGGHTLALTKDGTLWAWGDNAHGQLGIGSLVNRGIPVRVGFSGIWASMAAGHGHSLAVRKDGTLWAWGLNLNGQLGDGTNIDKVFPVQVGTETTWAAVAAGYGHSLAIRKDSSLWAWGSNNSGQLGDNTLVEKNIPVQVASDKGFTAVAAGREHSLGIKNDNTLWAWGSNNNGQLGDGTNVNKNVPVQVNSDNSWGTVAAGYYYSLGLRKDGSILAWGDNFYGQLGDGSTDESNTPVQAGTESNWSAVAAGYGHSLGVKKDGTLWAWGYNKYGQLGDGSVTDSDTPVQVGSDNTWATIAAGYYHTGAIKAGGTLWLWGNNLSGQLGDGTLTKRSTPTQIKQ